MASDDRTANDGRDGAAQPRSRLFAVRLWTEDVDSGPELRGNVREVVSGAYRSFRDWSDLTGFMIARMQEDGRIPADHLDEGGSE